MIWITQGPRVSVAWPDGSERALARRAGPTAWPLRGTECFRLVHRPGHACRGRHSVAIRAARLHLAARRMRRVTAQAAMAASRCITPEIVSQSGYAHYGPASRRKDHNRRRGRRGDAKVKLRIEGPPAHIVFPNGKESRPRLADVTAVELRERALELRGMAATARTLYVRDALERLAGRFERLAGERGGICPQ
jgi:hypothetical protein